MAAAFSLRVIFLIHLVLVCSGQYYYYYSSFYNYSDYGGGASTCPFGINGMCQCENDIIDCTSQGLSAIPADLPSTTKQLILKDNKITSIDYVPLVHYLSLEHLDLSQNNIGTLPESIFEIHSLKSINLANNPWQCDCNLKWLSVWLLTEASTDTQVLDAASTNCLEWPSRSILDISPADFLPCAVQVRSQRSVRSTTSSSSSRISPIHTFSSWDSVCFYWFPQDDCSVGPSQAGSCVLSHASHDISLVTYSLFTTQTDAGACRDYCFTSNASYHAFQNSTFHCVCGEENPTVCTDCNSSSLSSTALTLCAGSYMRILQTYHVLSDVALTFTAPVTAHAPTTFMLSGCPAVVGSISWNFGDGSQFQNTSLTLMSHTYVHPGLFNVLVDLCGAGVCQTVQVQVKVDAEIAEATLACPTTSEVSRKIELNATLSHPYESVVKWSRTTTGGTVNVGACQSGWTDFADRCFKHITQVKSFNIAEQRCNQEGGTLFQLYHLTEEAQLPSLLALSTSSTVWIGAKYSTEYRWEATGEPAYFLRALSIDRSAGDCLVLTFTGVVAADCSSQHTLLCQADPSPCPLGSQLGSSNHCFYLNSAMMTWQQARQTCQGAYGGDLAVLNGQTIHSIVSSALGVSSSTWLGLTAPHLLGHYKWVDGQALGWSNWAISIGQAGTPWPCVSLNSLSQWEPTACDQPLPFICQYSLDAVVSADLHLAGAPDLQVNGSTFQMLTRYTQALPKQAGYTLVLPGVWFAQEGQLFEVNLQVEPQSSNNVLAVQVLRPTCPSHKSVIKPGCDQNAFTKCGPSTLASTCPGSSPCSSPETHHDCPLTQTCIPSSTPCSCATPPTYPVDCVNVDVDSEMSYSLVGQSAYEVPAAGGSFLAKIQGGIAVQAYDILAVQVIGSDLGLCRADMASLWRQVVFTRVGSNWTEVNKDMSVSSFTKHDNYLCHISALYGITKTVPLPDKLAYVPSSKWYSFEAEVVGSQTGSKSCSVETFQKVGSLTFVHPTLHHPNTNPTVYIESGVPQKFVISVASGSDLQAVWTLGSGTKKVGSFVATCPTSVPSSIVDCIEPTSQLALPFLVFDDTFSTSSSLMSLALNVSNSLGWKNLTVAVISLDPIQDLKLSHPSCSAVTGVQCNLLVEVGIPQQFFASKSSGTVDLYSFQENGTVLQSLQSSSLTHTFPSPGVYIMSVSASNGMETVDAPLQVNVNAKVRAQVAYLTVEPPSPLVGEVNTGITITMTGTVAAGAELNVTWNYGDGQVDTSLVQLSTALLNIYQIHTYTNAGTYTLNVTLRDAFGGELNETAVINVLSPITSLNTSTSPKYVAVGNMSFITAQVLSSTPTPSFGNLTYSFSFSDGSKDKIVTSRYQTRSVRHVYKSNGTFNVSIQVKNAVSSVNSSVLVLVQACPSNVRLTYNGPKNLSELLRFSANNASDGSDLDFLFDFGDGSPKLLQQDTIAFHSYNTSGSYNATVIASNDVCSVFDFKIVIAMDSDTLVVRKIHHDRYAAVGELVQFTVEVVTLDMQKVKLVWSVGKFSLPLQSTNKFVYMFHSVGNHTVSVNLTLDSGVTKHTSTTVTILEVVSNVTMTAPSLVSYSENSPAQEGFLASSYDGTGVSYNWFNNTALVAQGSNISLQMDTAGVFNISVIAYNEVSQIGSWTLVTVEHIVENLVITCNNCINGKYIAKSAQTNITCSYLGSSTSVTWRTGGSLFPNSNTLSHVYTTTGPQIVEVSVFNQVSMENATFEVISEEGISSVSLIADNPVTMEGSSVNLTAVHNEGMHVTYTWQCGSQAMQVTNTMFIMVTFPTWGLHTCNVSATNNVSSQRASVDIKVLQTITTLGIKNLAPNGTLFVPVKKSPGVEADCNTDFEVQFTWNGVKAGAVIFTQMGANLTHKFDSVGHYELNLIASNAISSMTVTIQVEALWEISNLQLTANTTTVMVGSWVELTATINQGTNPLYEWSLNNMPWTAVASQSSFPFSFSSADIYVIGVTVSNQLNAETVNITVEAQYPVQNIQITSTLDFKHPYVSHNQQVGFHGNVTHGSNPQFTWAVTSSSGKLVTVPGALLQQSFSETGQYSIEFEASNNVSQVIHSFTVYVERPIISLNMTAIPVVVATKNTVSFLAVPNSDAIPVTFSWTVEGQVLSVVSFLHAFQSAGSYVVKLVAENNISRLETDKIIEVQDPLTALQMINCNATRQAGLATALTATAQGTGVSFSWSVLFPTGNQTALASSMTLTFPAEGIYPVYLSAWNKVGNDALTCQLKVQEAITSITIQITSPPIDYIFTNQNVTFSVKGNLLNGADYTWTFIGLSTEVTSSPSHVMFFNTPQQVTLEVYAKNDISQAHASINFTVQDLQCNLPSVTPVGSTSRSILRSKSTQFDVYINMKGCQLYPVVHTWRIYDLADCSQLGLPPYSASSLTLTSVEMDEPTLILPVGLLPATVSTFCIHYTLGYEKTPVAEEVFFNLTALTSPLVAVISGGGWRQVDGSKEVCMEGGLSYNPDRLQSGSNGLLFAWMCQLVSATGNCFQPVTNSSSKLCMSTLTHGIYNITLTVFLPGLSSQSVSQELEVWVTTPPLLSVGVECVSCQATSSYGISSSQHTALSASCTGCNTPVTYSWSVTEDTGTAISLGPHDTSTGTTAPNLVVLRNTVLRDGHSYIFFVTVVATDGSRTQGKASITLQPNLPPTGGICTVSPDTVTALQDVVTVSCNGWTDPDSSDAELQYEIKVVDTASSQSYLLYYGTRQTQTVYLAPMPGSRNGSTQLVVSVLDEAGSRAQAITKSIHFLSTGTPAANMSQEIYMAANTTLTTLMQQGDPVPLLQYAVALTQMLNSASTGSLQTEDLRMQAAVRTAITVCVTDSSTVQTLQQAQQMAYLLDLLTEVSAEYQMSGCHTLMISTLQSIVSVLKSNVRSGLDREDFAFNSILSSVYHLMQAISFGSSSFSSTSTASVSLLEFFPQFTDLLSAISASTSSQQSLDFSTTALTLDHTINIVSNAFDAAENTMSVVLTSLVLDEESVTYQLGGMKAVGSRVTAGTVSSYYEVGGGRFRLPASMFSSLSNSEEMLKIMFMLDPNPFTWGYINQLAINSQVPTLSFKFANGSDIPIAGLAAPIEVLMFASDNNTYSIANSSLLQSIHYDPLAQGQFETWTLTATDSKKLVIDASMGTSGVSALNIQVRVEALPNATDQLSGGVPSAAIKAYLGVGFEASQDSYSVYKEITTADMALGTDHRAYTFFVSAEDFNNAVEYTVTLMNSDSFHDVNISASMYLTSCQYYQEATRAWSAAGCSVSDVSIPIATKCLCNHLTAFGSGSLVPISSIRFTDLDELELGLNPVTLIAVGTILLIYIIGVIICRRLDCANLRHISVVPLCGRDGAYKYEVTVITGRQIGAGTSAHVGIKLYGDIAKSEPRHLTKTCAFTRNSCDTFLVAFSNDLGTLHKLRIWHDNTGSSPCWYLTQIQVKDLQSGQCYVFSANTWLSLEVADGMLQKELVAASPEELQSFSRVFHTSFSNNMAERHMWLSIINRPIHSRFTRVQRATCSVTLIFLYMFMDAMWYGLLKDKSDANESITWKVIGWEEVIIALVSAGAIFPVALLLICLFKRSRSKADVFTQALRPQSAQTLEIDAMCDMSQYEESLRTMTPNEDWNSFFERESTTDSIPPISSQLRRTTAGIRRDSGNSINGFPGSSRKSTVHCIRRTQDLMWTQENILKSWPEKLPSFMEEEKAKETTIKEEKTKDATKKSEATATTSTTATASSSKPAHGSAASKINKTTSLTAKNSPTPALKKTKSAPPDTTGNGSKEHKFVGKQQKTAAKTATAGKSASSSKADANDSDDHEEFMQRLDEIDRALQKSASIRSTKASARSNRSQSHPPPPPPPALGLVKKHSSRSSQGAIEDLFDSDDEWANEDIDGKGSESKGKGDRSSSFNPRQDPNLDRRASVTSLMRMRSGLMLGPGSAGSSFLRRDSTFRRDSSLHSFALSEKSRSTLSAMLRSRIHSLNGPEENGFRLPWFFVYVGYALCLCLSVMSIIMVLLYGYNFGSAIAVRWLLSVFIAFMFSIFILEPLKVILLTLYVAVIVKDAEKEVESDSIDVMPSIEANEQLKEVKFRPLGGFALLQAQEEGRKKLRLRTMIRQTLAYLLLTATLLAVVNVWFGPSFLRASNHLENNFIYSNASATSVSASSTGSVHFYNITSTDEFWDWARDVLVPGLYRPQLVPNEENPVLLGPARLRQIRSVMVDCLTYKVDERTACVGRLKFTEDTEAYSPGWLNNTGNASWIFSSAEQLEMWSKFGQDILYSGGGYVQELGTSFNQTLDILQQLKDDHWLDRRSRALFVEWTFYSAPEDLFSAVTLLLEFPISGGVLASHTVKTQRLYFFDISTIDPLDVCQILLLLPGLYLLIQTFVAMCEQKSKFLRCISNWLQMTCGLLCLGSIGMYIACVIMATDTLDRFSSQWASFTNFERVVHMHEMLRLLHACLLFLLFIKIAGQVRYIRPLSVYPRTLATAFGKLAGATFIFLILLLTYTQIGYLFYGQFVHSFRSFQNSLMSLCGVMKGSVNFDPVLAYQPIFSHFYFYSFYPVVYGLFVALVIAVLQDAYKLIRSQMYFKSSLEPQDHEMIEFMLRRFKLWAGIIKPKPAFRRVKFKGLPSLPSRGSSSATSSRRPLSQTSRERNTPTPDLIASMGNPGDALDRLLPAWEKLLTLLGTMEMLEKEEQRQVGRVQIAFNRWTSEQDKKGGGPSSSQKSQPSKKPPTGPKSKLSRFRSNFQSSSSSGGDQASAAKAAQQRHAMTSPPGMAQMKPMVRTFSDQGGQSFGLDSGRSTDNQQVRFCPDDMLIADSSFARNKDAFPGSTSQRSQPPFESSKFPSAPSSAGHKGSAAASNSESASGLGRKGLSNSFRQLKLSTSKVSPDDGKKQAWGDG